MGRVSRLPDEAHHAESVHAATWVWKGLNHNYCVRQRKGWGQLRDLLIRVGALEGALEGLGWRDEGWGAACSRHGAHCQPAVNQPPSQTECCLPASPACPASLPLQENHPGGKLDTFVLSLGRPLYIQARLWGPVGAAWLARRLRCSTQLMLLLPCRCIAATARPA